jgi:putative ABC transport system permease protein
LPPSASKLSQSQQEASIVRDSFFLAWQYLRHHRFTTVVLVASITLIIYLPAALQVIVDNAETHFRSRADSTPLVVGPQGSPLELVLGSVYFDKPYEDVLMLDQLQRIEEQEAGLAIPLHVRFKARDCQIVGTTEDYLRLRNLRTVRGREWNLLGECLLGARAAHRLNLTVGDKLPVSSSTAFTLDNPPLRLHVAGVLAGTETPDDEAIFVDLETAWIIEGLGHGHAQGAPHGSSGAKPYTDITKENVSSFHFHDDDRAQFPITAVVVIPASEKAETLLLGQYFSPDEVAQIVRPRQVMDRLLESVLMIRSYMIAIVAVVSLATLLSLALVIILSMRLRRAEITTMSKLGCSRFTIASVLGSQIAIVVLASLLLATALALLTDFYGPELVRLLIL